MPAYSAYYSGSSGSSSRSTSSEVKRAPAYSKLYSHSMAPNVNSTAHIPSSRLVALLPHHLPFSSSLFHCWPMTSMLINDTLDYPSTSTYTSTSTRSTGSNSTLHPVVVHNNSSARQDTTVRRKEHDVAYWPGSSIPSGEPSSRSQYTANPASQSRTNSTSQYNPNPTRQYYADPTQTRYYR